MPKKITVLGGGPGGYVAALKAAQKGGEVTLIEKESLGGTCLNWGCIPTKAYLTKVSKANHLDLSLIKEDKDKIVNQLVQGVETLIAKNKINLIRGWGHVLNPRKILVKTGDQEIIVNNDYLILATGSVPLKLNLPGVDLPQVLDNRGILALKKQPKHLLIIGGGVIGVEFAQIFVRLGSKVTIVEYLPQILTGFDQELVRRLRPVLKNEGIDILTGAAVKGIESAQNGLEISLEGNQDVLLKADQVLLATGRLPNLTAIDPLKLGLELEGRFIKVNSRMQTNLLNVYAIGDLLPSPMLAHVASYEAEIAVRNIFNIPAEANYSAVPATVYTQPELASVGLTEAEVREAGIEYKLGKFPLTANGRALTKGKNYGLVKIIVNRNNAQILGAQILGSEASELIQILTLAIRWNLTIEQITDTIYGHPTLSESILECAQNVFGKATHSL